MHGVVESPGRSGRGARRRRVVTRGRAARRALFGCVGMALLALGCSDASRPPEPAAEAPAVLTERSRDAVATDDFLRMIFLPDGVVPTKLGTPAALRVFATASVFFEPAIGALEASQYPGLSYRADQNLAVLRCQPPDGSGVEPILASWPNALRAIASDLGGSFSCPPQAGSPENEVYCIASGYQDAPDVVIAAAIGRAIASGVQLFATPERADVVRRRFGMYPEFSGLGFSVKGTGDGRAVTAEHALHQSVVPEYLLRNATLADAGCWCILVPPYDGRDTAPLDPAFVVQAGGYGECRMVDRIERAGAGASGGA